jgi:putative nucleotidyltransferase with HDIG domain
MEKDELRAAIFSKIDELPTLPTVVPKILNLMEGSQSNASDVTEAMSKDPALTSKILKVANSAYYGFPQGISDLERAVALLGFNMVKSLAISMGVLNSLSSGSKGSRFSMKGLWIHSLAVATAMKELGQRHGKSAEGDHLFILGLLHDIGKVVLDQFFGNLYEQTLNAVEQDETMRLYEAERKVVGFDHGEVGAMLLKRWMFPEVMVNAIAAHHQRELPANTDAADLAMLRIADTLPQALGLGNQGNPSIDKIQDADLAVLRMAPKEVEAVKAFLDDAKDGIYAFFDAMH